jgi:hypothetical protein
MFGVVVNRLLHGAAQAPYALIWRGNGYANAVGGFNQTHLFAIKNHPMSAPRVPHLHAAISPSTVLGKIPFGIIYAIKFQALRLVAHISIEVLKLLPSLANRYAAASVIRERWIRHHFASVLHASPCVVNRRSGHAVTLLSHVTCINQNHFGDNGARQ